MIVKIEPFIDHGFYSHKVHESPLLTVFKLKTNVNLFYKDNYCISFAPASFFFLSLLSSALFFAANSAFLLSPPSSFTLLLNSFSGAPSLYLCRQASIYRRSRGVSMPIFFKSAVNRSAHSRNLGA